jgi:quercetin dioxygenase-like cupin family protein/hemerythrin-like domain-containing protein
MPALWGHADELARFDAQAFRPTVLFESDRMKVALAALEPGQQIDPHAPDVDVALAVMQGVGEIWVDDAPRTVRAGDVIVVPAGVTRGMRALDDRLVILHAVSPPPTAAHHEAERRAWPSREPASAGPRDAIHAEHEELLPHFGHVADLADEAVDLPDDQLHERLGHVLGFLRGVLLPHAGVEESALYPVVDAVLRAVGGGTRTMSVDHRAIGTLIDDLAAAADRTPNAATRREIQRLLDAIVALVRVHFEKEEVVYLPLLDRLSAEEAGALLDTLETAPGHAHAH